MLVTSLTADIRSLVGDEDSTSYIFSDNVYRDTKTPNGLKQYNLREATRYEITGTGSAAVFNPTPTEYDATKICLYTAIHIIDGEIQKAARNAVVVTDVAGRTDMTAVPKELREHKKSLVEQLAKLRGEAVVAGVVEQIEVDDESF